MIQLPILAALALIGLVLPVTAETPAVIAALAVAGVAPALIRRPDGG
jgi:hypothetical protein